MVGRVWMFVMRWVKIGKEDFDLDGRGPFCMTVDRDAELRRRLVLCCCFCFARLGAGVGSGVTSSGRNVSSASWSSLKCSGSSDMNRLDLADGTTSFRADRGCSSSSSCSSCSNTGVKRGLIKLGVIFVFFFVQL